MRIEVSKNELAGALSALGKLVCRTSPVILFRSLLIEKKGSSITFQTRNMDETITFTMDVPVEGDFRAIVAFESFRLAVRNCRSKMVALEVEAESLTVDAMAIRLEKEEWPADEPMPGDTLPVTLPENFVGLLQNVASIVDRNNYRKILQGIHLCREGVIATNGKELLQIPALLSVDALTIPFPLALLATKESSSGLLFSWNARDARYFTIQLAHWAWRSKALSGIYPNWQQVVPAQKLLAHAVKFSEKETEKLVMFLKSVPDNPPNNPVTFSKENDQLMLKEGTQEVRIPAEFTGNWESLSLTVNKQILLRLLGLGHTQIQCSDGHAPFLASGGIGTYLAMPLYLPVVSTQQPQKEEKQMNETLPNETENTNPLDELAAAIEEFKQKIRLISDESMLLSRKVKEASIQQKQKEREFLQARRAIERIRMAI